MKTLKTAIALSLIICLIFSAPGYSNLDEQQSSHHDSGGGAAASVASGLLFTAAMQALKNKNGDQSGSSNVTTQGPPPVVTVAEFPVGTELSGASTVEVEVAKGNKNEVVKAEVLVPQAPGPAAAACCKVTSVTVANVWTDRVEIRLGGQKKNANPGEVLTFEGDFGECPRITVLGREGNLLAENVPFCCKKLKAGQIPFFYGIRFVKFTFQDVPQEQCKEQPPASTPETPQTPQTPENPPPHKPEETPPPHHPEEPPPPHKPEEPPPPHAPPEDPPPHKPEDPPPHWPPYGPPPPPPTETQTECACCCHLITSFNTGGKIDVKIASPATDSAIEVPVGAQMPLAANAADGDTLIATCQQDGVNCGACPPCVSEGIVDGPVTDGGRTTTGGGSTTGRTPTGGSYVGRTASGYGTSGEAEASQVMIATGKPPSCKVPCPSCSSVLALPLPGTLKYQWKIVSGEGWLISKPPYPHPHSAIAEGPAAIYEAPDKMPADPNVEIHLIVDDDAEYLTDIDDDSVLKVVKLRLVPPLTSVTVPISDAAVSSSGGGASTGKCDCTPVPLWQSFRGIQPHEEVSNKLTVCANKYAVLSAGADDADELNLQCVGSKCSSPPVKYHFNDAVKFRWVPSNGKIIGTSEKVVYKAPPNSGTYKVQRYVDDSGVHPKPADEVEFELVPYTIDVFQVKVVAVGDYIVPGSKENIVRYQLDLSPVDAVRLEVFDKDNNKVRTATGLPTSNDAATGYAEYKWDGLDDKGAQLKPLSSPFRLKIIATKGGTDCPAEASSQVVWWPFTYKIEDKEPAAGAGASGIEPKTVVPMLVQTTVEPQGGEAVPVSYFDVKPAANDVEVTLMNSFKAADFFMLYTSPTKPNQINYTITVQSQEGGALDKAGNEWDMDPAAAGMQRTTLWRLRIDSAGKVTMIEEKISA